MAHTPSNRPIISQADVESTILDFIEARAEVEIEDIFENGHIVGGIVPVQVLVDPMGQELPLYVRGLIERYNARFAAKAQLLGVEDGLARYQILQDENPGFIC